MADVSLQSIFDEARRALDSGDAEQAIGIARHILQYAPDVIEGHRLLGEAYLNAEQAEQAVAAFEAVLRADPENIAAYYGLGLARQSLDRRVEAIQAFERALEIQPNLADLRTQLLRLYSETPGSAGQFRLSRAGLGRLYARGQMYGQAIDEFRAVLDNDPDRDDVRVALAEILWRDGQEDEAAEWCRDAVKRRPELLKPTMILGYLQLAAGQPQGEELWRRAARQEPTLQTAQTLFDILPPVQIAEPAIPAFNERAWREEQGRIAAEAPAEPAPVAVASEDDDFFGDSWLGSAAVGAPPPLPPPISQPEAEDNLSDDDLLASLLGFDDQSESEDLADLPEVEPFALDETATPTEMPESLHAIGIHEADSEQDEPVGGVKPFSFDDWNLGEDDEAPRAQPPAASAEERSGATPFTVDKDEHAEAQQPQTFSLQDLADDVQPFSFEEHPSATEVAGDLGGVQPFSLDDWNLEDDEAPGNATPGGSRADSGLDAEDGGALKPFSLHELPLDALDEDRSDFLAGPSEEGHAGEGDTSGFAWERPGWRSQQSEPQAEEAREGSIFAKLLRGRQPGEQTPQTETPPADTDDVDLRSAAEQGRTEADRDHTEDDLSPFSLSDLGITDEEARAAGITRQPAEQVQATADQPEDDFSPFSLRDLGLVEDEAAGQAAPSAAQESAAGAEVRPFSLSDLGLDEQEWKFEGDIDEATGTPRAAVEGAAPALASRDVEDEWPEAHPIESSPSSSEQAGTAEPEVEPFSFADLGLGDEELADAEPEAAGDEPSAEIARPSEPEPFSFADLGLNEEDFADIDLGESVEAGAAPQSSNQASKAEQPAEASAVSETERMDFDLSGLAFSDEEPTAGGMEQMGTIGHVAASAEVDQEEMTPFSLADLGLTDEELVQMGVEAEAETPQAGQPAGTGSDTGGSAADQEMTPFSLANLGLTDEELELFGVADEQAYGTRPEDAGGAAAPQAEVDQADHYEGPEPEASAGETAAPRPHVEKRTFSFDDLGLGGDAQNGFSSSDGTETADRAGKTASSPSIREADTAAVAARANEVEPSGAMVSPPESDETSGDRAADPRVEPDAGVNRPQTSSPATGSVPAELAQFYEQIAAQPESHAMRLAIARMSEQRNDIERALEQYKQLIRRNALLDPVVEDLEELTMGEHDRPLLRRIHRLLGDAYMKQDRFQDAMDQYSWT